MLFAALAALYAVASVACFIAYALDKSAARKGRRRTPERTLLLLGLAGGWPGALAAQQWLRHKSSKTSFLAMFWFTVVLNVAALLALAALFQRLQA
ncbi:DUF1294 domain-containing protein [Pseudoduganella sp. DS3]|uniref:DUF1294 domain-containing protein n=1 Tax=Pseudoduganella guangdongensis TaxID=2692179 RepID=A0A6N9HMQ3_9BURK|nr:DUF1294 domain-containing protein [Pseudoduganella guangdongensis]MYN04646.1 DUF1294 domain-containing protein [Pseudoduganella guangdongensis]